MNQINRKSKRSNTEIPLTNGTKNNEEDKILDSLIASAGGKVDLEALLKNTSEAELLRLAGGHVEMAAMSGTDGLKLRTILAHRALHIKGRLRKRAIERNLMKPPSNMNFYNRQIAPLFHDSYISTSSEEDEEKDKAEAKARRQKRRDQRASKKLIENRLTDAANTFTR